MKIVRLTLAATLLITCGLAHASDLFVSDGASSGVVKFNGTNFLTSGVIVPANTGTLSDAEGITFGPDGNLYVVSAGNNKVLKFNPATGAFLGEFVPAGTLNNPFGLTFGPDHNLYVANQGGGSFVAKYDGTTGAYLGVFALPQGGPSIFEDVKFGRDGNLYVSDYFGSRVLKYDGTTGNYLGVFVGGINAAEGLAWGPDGNLYAVSYFDAAVKKVDPNGNIIGTFVPDGSNGLTGPRGLAFGPDNNLYVVDNTNGNVLVFDGTTGAYVRTLPSGDLSEPSFPAFAPNPLQDFYQIRYAANLNIGDSVVNVINAGTLSGTDPAGRICVNVYTFDPAEEMISCCTCPVTPNGLNSLSVRSDLISNTLTPGVPTSVVIKLLASTPIAGVCNAGSPTADTLVRGMRAWGTTLHALPGSPARYGETETPFSKVELSPSELTKLTTYCQFIQANGSGFGICKSCRAGGLGASAK